MSNWLLVELHADLVKHHTTRTGVRSCIKQVPGIKSLTDISAISRETADALVGGLFLPEDQTYAYQEARKRRRGRKAS